MRNSGGQRRTGSGTKRTPPLGLGLHPVGFGGNPGTPAGTLYRSCLEWQKGTTVVSVGLQMPPRRSLQALHPQRLGWESRTPAGRREKVARSLHFSVRGSPPVQDTWANLSWEGFRHSRGSGVS